MAHLLRKYVIAPTNEIPLNAVGAIHESPVTLFVLSFGYTQTNGSLSISVGEGLAPPVLCSHYLLDTRK